MEQSRHLPTAQEFLKARLGKPIRLLITQIEPDTDNARLRLDQGKLRELADSMGNSGQISPVIVRPLPGHAGAEQYARYRLKAGTRRRAAALLLGWTELDAIVMSPETSDLDADVLALADNLQRESLTSYEQAAAFRTMRDVHKISGTDVARLVGKSASWVLGQLAVIDCLCPVVLEQWRAGHPLATTDSLRRLAYFKAAAGEPDHQLQAVVWRQMVDGVQEGRPNATANERWLLNRAAQGKRIRQVHKTLLAVDLYFVALKKRRGKGAPKLTVAWAHDLVRFLMGARHAPPPGMDLAAFDKKPSAKGP